MENQSHQPQNCTILLCKVKRQNLLTCKVSRYCLLALNGRIEQRMAILAYFVLVIERGRFEHFQSDCHSTLSACLSPPAASGCLSPPWRTAPPCPPASPGTP